jgi:hypothetical protein
MHMMGEKKEKAPPKTNGPDGQGWTRRMGFLGGSHFSWNEKPRGVLENCSNVTLSTRFFKIL